jgi:exopolysaccharide biosynthesis polyprenyl glycosylphosphotransferase
MIALRRQLLVTALMLSDLASSLLAFVIAAHLLTHPFKPAAVLRFYAQRIKLGNLLIFLGLFAAWHLVFAAAGLYQSGRFSRLRDEAIRVVKAALAGTVLLLLAAAVFTIDIVTPAFAAVFWFTCTVLVTVMRIVLRRSLRRVRRHGRNMRNVLIVGTNERAVAFARRVVADHDLGYRLVGFVDSGWSGRSAPPGDDSAAVVVDFEGLPAFLRNHVVDEVMICLPVKSFYNQIAATIALCEQQGIVVRLLSDFFTGTYAVARTESFQGDPIITIHTGTMSGVPLLAKRVMDVSLSLLAILALAPFLAAIAVFVKITSRGPIFFVQERMGLNRRIFHLYKFRTMDPAATRVEPSPGEGATGDAGTGAPRVTGIGRFLRETSMDELPQLMNVLKGDMSLVGPRPLPVYECARFDQDRHRRRFSVRPGMTCLRHVNGQRPLPFERRLELDLKYIEQWSLWLDLKLLARTIPAVIRLRGAA